MGISGLLPLVKPLMRVEHISKFRGKRVAVDGYAWLHKACYSCCVELAQGMPSNAWVTYCLSFVDLLLHHGVHVYMVFDGANLPAKKLTENDRHAKRKAACEKGQELMKKGDKQGARTQFARAVDVTPQMAAHLISVLRQNRSSVDVVVAPYEADAQLAAMSMDNVVDLVISEDSDTIPFGCKEVLFKLERDGSCQHLVLEDIYSKPNKAFDLQNFSPEMVTAMCIASGCDYVVRD
jgi:exonuclease-1